MSMHKITLDDNQLEEVQRAMLRSALRDMEQARDELANLETIAPWPANTLSSDAQNAVKLLRETLDILDAIGWPRDETRVEWEARMAAATATKATS